MSNETQSWDVFFDNLSVQHKQGPILEENHYYPFGLTMAGINDKALKTNYAANKYSYNSGSELANKEFSDGTGLEMYETDFRGYDPQLGRFWQQDPIEEFFEDWSPYTYTQDNPVLFNDPLGLAGENPNEEYKKKRHKPKPGPLVETLTPIVVVGYKKKPKSNDTPTVTVANPSTPPPINFIYWPNSTNQERQQWKKDQGLYYDRLHSGQSLIQGGESEHYLNSLEMYQLWTKANRESRVMQLGAVGIIFGPELTLEIAAEVSVGELYEQAYFWTEHGYNIVVSDLIYAVRYGLANRLTIDQIIRLERLAEQHRDLNKVLTPKLFEKIFSKLNSILKH